VNGFLFPNTAGGYDNTYILYRVEFNPNDPRVSNWRLQNGDPNPDFFYDPNPAPQTNPRHSFAEEWRSRAVAIISTENTDAVRLVSDVNGWRPDPLVHFAATAMENESLDVAKAVTPANDSRTASSEPSGSETEEPSVLAGAAGTQYLADYGHWAGPENDMTRPLPPSWIMGSVPPIVDAERGRFVPGPRIQVYERRPVAGGGEQLILVFDGGEDAARILRQRMLSWDSRRGIVNFAIRRTSSDGSDAFRSSIDNNYAVDLKRDTASNTINGVTVPGSLGAALQAPLLAPTATVVPGSEQVLRSLDGSDQRVTRMQRVGYTGLGAALDRIVAQADLGPNEYNIDYRTGLIQFSDRDPGIVGQPVLVRYQWRTNRPTDLVRVSYATREVLTVSVGLQQFEGRTGEPQSVQLSTRVRVRNMAAQ
jgi:hypothetical protein